MKVIKFCVKGFLNSFRIPFFRTYHKSFLAPPKTTIIGMITNIMGKPESWYYKVLDEQEIDVSVVINHIEGKAKDLWTYKTFQNKSNMHGRSVIRRDKLYKAYYTIYLHIPNNTLYHDVLKALRCPINIPSLGLDDELVHIFQVEPIELKINSTKVVNSVFMDKGYTYKAKVIDLYQYVEMPTANSVSLSFDVKYGENGVRESRTARSELRQVEFINCELEFEEDIDSYTDGINKVVFY